MTLAEVLVALGVLLIAILTMIGYIATVHRAAREGKHQAIASVYARSMLEQLRDSGDDFETAHNGGLVVTRSEVLLDGEAAPEDNEVGRKGATEYTVEGKTALVSGSIYSLVVNVSWEESGRQRQVVLESLGQRPL